MFSQQIVFPVTAKIIKAQPRVRAKTTHGKSSNSFFSVSYVATLLGRLDHLKIYSHEPLKPDKSSKRKKHYSIKHKALFSEPYSAE